MVDGRMIMEIHEDWELILLSMLLVDGSVMVIDGRRERFHGPRSMHPTATERIEFVALHFWIGYKQTDRIISNRIGF